MLSLQELVLAPAGQLHDCERYESIERSETTELGCENGGERLESNETSEATESRWVNNGVMSELSEQSVAAHLRYQRVPVRI